MGSLGITSISDKQFVNFIIGQEKDNFCIIKW